jgi:hypothetical protein
MLEYEPLPDEDLRVLHTFLGRLDQLLVSVGWPPVRDSAGEITDARFRREWWPLERDAITLRLAWKARKMMITVTVDRRLGHPHATAHDLWKAVRRALA